MNRAFFTGTLAALLCVLLPVLAAQSRARSAEAPPQSAAPAPVARTPQVAAQPLAPDTETEPQESFDAAFSLPVLLEGQTVSMALDEYLTGVLLAELPSSFSMEAMKAQATACRTYALRRYQSRKHGAAALCTDASCCEGWRDPRQCPPEAVEKARQAAAQTDGTVILYGGKLIDATFFSCSGGRTEDAVAVWGSDLPYLRAVDSPGEEAAKHFEDELSVPLEEFAAVLKQAAPEADFSGEPARWVGAARYTDGGGVEALELGGAEFGGKQLRKLFGLNATAFTLEITEQAAVFHTRGFGHRVGMSQYGAEAMAQAGADYTEILKHYYQGVELQRME